MESKVQKKPHILLALSNGKDLGDAAQELSDLPFQITSEMDSKVCLNLLDKGIDAVVGDLKSVENALLEKAANRGAEFILAVENQDVSKAVGLMQCGVFDYIMKPFRHGELGVRVGRALERQELKRKTLGLKGLDENGEKLLQNEKLASLSRLVSGMAHEINNPLTAVIGYSQLLLDGNARANQDATAKQLGVIRDQAMRCGKIIQDLLGFARKRKPQLAPLDLCKIVEISSEIVHEDCKLNHIKVESSFSNKEIMVRGDGGQLQKVFVSILNNAVHALEKKSGERKIEVLVTETSENVEVKITDNGCGIQEEHLSRIYEPFFTTKDVGKGSGLGLSLCYGFLAEHGGTINAKSRWGHGTTFTVQLPKLIDTVEEPSKPLQAPTASNEILVVEDEKVVAGFMQQILSHYGYRVDLAYDGEEAQRKILAKNYDLVLCDYRIPKMTGFELYEKISQERPIFDNRFIFVTASLHFAEKFKGEEFITKKGLAYLQKPFSAQDLLALVEKKLRPRAA